MKKSFPRNALDFAVVTARRPNWRLNSYLKKGFLKTQWLWNSSWIFQISVYPCFIMIFYNLPFQDIQYFKTLQVKLESFLLSPFPWSPMVRLSADRRGNTWSKTNFGNSQQQFIGVAWWLWGPMLNYPFVMEVPEVLRCRKKPKPSRWKRGHVGFLYFVRSKMLGGSHQYFRVSPPWNRKQTFVYRVCTQYSLAHIHIFVNICQYVYVQITLHLQYDFWHNTRFKIQRRSWNHLAPSATFPIFMKQLQVLVLSTRRHLIDLPQIQANFSGGSWVPKENPALIQQSKGLGKEKVNFPIQIQIFLFFFAWGFYDFEFPALNGFFG